MLTTQDIQQLTAALREVFATKDELAAFRDEQREAASTLLTTVDGYAKKADAFFQELVVQKHRMDRHEKWIQQLAHKLGVALEF